MQRKLALIALSMTVLAASQPVLAQDEPRRIPQDEGTKKADVLAPFTTRGLVRNIFVYGTSMGLSTVATAFAIDAAIKFFGLSFVLGVPMVVPALLALNLAAGVAGGILLARWLLKDADRAPNVVRLGATPGIKGRLDAVAGE